MIYVLLILILPPSFINESYGGWLRNPAPVENGGPSHYLVGVSTILYVIQDFATIHSKISIKHRIITLFTILTHG